MSEHASMVTMEGDVRRSVRQAYFADGLFDLVFGLGVLLAGIMVFSEKMMSMLYIPVMLVTLLLPAAKKRWVQPRVGYVKPGRPTRARTMLMLGLSLLLLVGLLVTIRASRQDTSPVIRRSYLALSWVMSHFGLLIGLVAGAIMAWNGFDLGIARLSAYGLGLGLAGLLSEWNGQGIAWREQLSAPELFGALFFALLGAIMMAVGAVVFAQFLRENPVNEEAR